MDNGTNFNGVGQFEFALVTSTNISSQATATAHLSGAFVTSYTVVSGGNGYTSIPTVTISGGGGSGATATAVISGGVVTAINPGSAGTGYTSAPTVTVAAPPPTFSYTTYWSNDGTSSAGSEPETAVNVAVADGLFTVVLGDTNLANMTSIPVAVFTEQSALQLQIWFSDGTKGFAVLSPLQNLTPAPYAIQALNANSANELAGVVGNNTIAPGVFATVGGGEGNYSTGYGATVGGGADNDSIGGVSTVAGGQDNNSLGYGSTVGGGYFNSSTNIYATVAGGYENLAYGNSAAVAGGNANIASGDYSAVGGGNANTASASYSTVGGGADNTASAYADTVGGGVYNTASSTDGSATVGGGYGNTANADSSTVGGGYNNTASGAYATVSGGASGTASGQYSTVSGGNANLAQGNFSWAGGNSGHALYQGDFIWADDNGGTLATTAFNQFMVRAGGGFVFYTGTGGGGAQLAAGATAWSVLSDRNAKKDIQPANCRAVLDKLVQVPIDQWHYKWENESGTPNLGPMAQDFKHAFFPGRDDKSITTLEFDGVELAAIQGLNQKVEDKNATLQAQANEIADLKARLEKLEQLISAKNGDEK